MSNYTSRYSRQSSVSHRISALIKENAEKDDFIQILEGDLVELRQYLGKLKDKEHEVIGDLEEEIITLKQGLKSEKQRRKKEIQERNYEISRLSKISSKRRKSIKKLSNVQIIDIHDLFQSTLDDIKYMELQDDLDQIDFDEMLDKQQEIKQLATMKTQISELKDKNDEYEDDGNNEEIAKEKIAKLEKRLSRKSTHVQKLKKLVDSMIVERRTKNRNENIRLKKVISNRNRKLASMKKEMNGMNQSIDQTVNFVNDNMKEKLDEKSKEVKELRNLVDEYQKMKAINDMKQEDKESQIKALKDTVNELQDQLKVKDEEINQDKIWLVENENKLRRLTVIGDKSTKSSNSTNTVEFLWIFSIFALFGSILYNINIDYQYWQERIQFDAQFGVEEDTSITETTVKETESGHYNLFASWNAFGDIIGVNDENEKIQDKDLINSAKSMEEIIETIEKIIDLKDQPSNEPIKLIKTTDLINQDYKLQEEHKQDEKDQNTKEQTVEETAGMFSMLEPLSIGAGFAFITYVVWRKIFSSPRVSNKSWRRDSAGRLSSRLN